MEEIKQELIKRDMDLINLKLEDTYDIKLRK